jgi:hypothetical protein
VSQVQREELVAEGVMYSLSLGDRGHTGVHMRQCPAFWEGKEKATNARLHADEESPSENFGSYRTQCLKLLLTCHIKEYHRDGAAEQPCFQQLV